MKAMKSFFSMSCWAVAALAITASCSNDELDGIKESSKANTFITASFEQPTGGAKTRTTLGGNNAVLWQSGDAFRLFHDGTSDVFSTNERGASASFGASISGGITDASYALFPVMTGVDVTLSGTTATTTLRNVIPFSQATNGPMWADASENYANLSFKHLAGLLKLTVSGLPATTGEETLTLKITADKNIAGKATVDFSAGGEPYLVVSDEASAAEVYNEITVTEITTDGTPTVFYVPLPVKTLGELSVNIYKSTDTSTPLYKEKKWTNVAVARAMIRSASFGFETFKVGTSSGTVSDAIKAAVPSTGETSTTTTVEITGHAIDATDDNDQNKKIEVPVSQNQNVALDFGTAPTTSEDKPLNITEADLAASTPSADESTNTITVTMPKADVAAVTIETPNSTVELTSSDAGESDKTKYTTITATTANNTLVVGDKVEIGTINVKGGNVRLKKGSVVTTIDNKTTGTIFVYLEEGVTQPSTAGNTVEFISTNLDANLETILSKGGSYILPTDLTLTKPLDVYGDVTFDLNGNTVTYDSSFNGGALFLVHRGGKLTVNDSKGGGTIDSYKSNYVSGILLTAGSDETNDAIKTKDAVLEINAGTIKGNDYAVVGQGNRHGTIITINGGTLESKLGPSIYHPQDGTLNINGGTLKGSECAVELRSGTLKITDGTLTSSASSFQKAANGSGTTMAGAALGVSQHSTDKPIKVTISGGTFNGIYAIYEEDLQNTNVSNIQMNVTGGTFIGQIFSQNCSSFIKGGNFNDVNAVNYIADGGKINVTLDKDASMEYFNLASGKTATIDLNGKTLNLTGDASKSLIDGTVVFKNGTIEVVEAAKQKHTIWGDSNCNLTLDNVTMNGGHWALLVQGPNAKILVNKSTINAKYFPFSTNASGSEDGSPSYGANATIILKNSDFIATETGFMNNVLADVTIDGCKFYGNHQAALLRGGKFTITNSTFTLKAELDDSDSENNHFKKGVTQWADGNRCAFAGITIGNFGNSSYQYETTVKMTGVTINVEGTYKDKFPALHACANSADGKGVTITYADSQFNSSYTPAIEFGTTNIKVNGVRVVESEGRFVVPTSTSAE